GNGGGINNYGTFKLAGGIISGNSAKHDGGVSNYGTFYMTGGAISNNEAFGNRDGFSGNGGGITNFGTTYMSGGEITGNTGGAISGVCISTTSTFNMSGGEITGNTMGYGVYNDGIFNLSGTAVIDENINSDSESNLYLPDGKIINMTGAFTGTVSVVPTSGTITEDWTSSGSTGTIIPDIRQYLIDVYESEQTFIAYTVQYDSVTVNYFDFAAAWTAATDAATSSGNPATVKLHSFLDASESSFGLTVDDTSYDYIYVSPDDYINLELNGFVISRAVMSSIVNGFVIKNDGNLIISDSVSGGGIIGGNNSGNGGGIYNNGTLTINGGVILFNYAENGGGIYNNGILDINGGTLLINTATNNGGGVYNNGTLTMSGGTITGNTAGEDYNGGGIYADGTFNLSGEATVTDNVSGGTLSFETFAIEGGSANNIYLPSEKIINITDTFSGEVSVTMETAGTITGDWANTESTGTIDTDIDTYTIIVLNDEKYLSSSYSVTYVPNGSESGAVPTDATAYLTGDTLTVLGNTGSLSKTGYTFSGWSYLDTTYLADDEISVTSDITLTAVWALDAPTISASSGYLGTYDGSAHNASVTATHDLS
ncbi:MAG: hypothetical protein EOM87_08405, partial [Clostridia bacterium]|nr:hypothetical protein [Clostridia bacterium]